MDAHSGLTEESRRMITALEMTGDFRVLRRFVPVEKFAEYENESSRSKAKVAMVIASRSTGASVDTGRLVMLSYVLVRFNPESGVVYEVDSVYAGTEDPGAPITEAVERAIGATDAQLSGTSFDGARISEDIARSSVIVCHQAEVERRFLEGRFEGMAGKWFVSAGREFAWSEFGATARNLDVLGYVVAGVFYSPGAPLLDAQVLVDLIARKAPDGRQVFKAMLDTSRVPHWRVWALGAQREHKRKLFDRGYKVAEGLSIDSRPIRDWVRVVRNLEAEKDYLAANIYGAESEIQVEKITGFERYTDRTGQCEVAKVAPRDAQKEAVPVETRKTTAEEGARATRQEPAAEHGRQPNEQRPAAAVAFADGDFPI